MILGPVRLLDSDGLRGPSEITIRNGRITRITKTPVQDADTPILCPSLVDLQVNGGGGLMVNDVTGPDDLSHIQNAHRALGTGHILPTLISDTPEVTRRIIEIAIASENLPGLHLEGPHLDVPGAHDPQRLRPLEDSDLQLYLNAVNRVETLMITVAPEQVTMNQIRRLSEAGVVVSLGHSNCSYDTAMAAFAAGARMVTHLFNAMSGLHHREPGLVGASLDSDAAFGLIADGHHVHDAALRLALAAGAERAIPVSDAMALTGSDAQSFSFQGREILAEKTRLTLPDGTLAGARASLLDGLRHLARITDTVLTELLPLGFDRPWRMLGHPPRRITEGATADVLMLHPDSRIEVLVGDTWRAC